MSHIETIPKGSPGWQVVKQIRRNGEMTVRELVKALGVTTTAVRLQVDRLVRDGILTVDKRGGRRGRPSDVFRLTERGQSLVSHKYDELIHDIVLPESNLRVIGAFIISGLAFSALGVLLGAVLPNARAAQALGVLLWFVMLILGGAGPPPEVLTGAMDAVGRATPLRHAIRATQDGWLGLDAGLSWLIVAMVFVGATVTAIRFFRWE